MNIRKTVNNLQKIYEEMAQTFSGFQNGTGLSCLPGCGRCCLNPDVEASVLEMLPLALKIYDEGKLEEWLLKMQNPATEYCVLYDGDENGKGKCGHYKERASICRMFGVAGFANKKGDPTLSVCKHIRENDPEKARKAESDVDPKTVPMMAKWTSHVAHLGDPAIQRKIPINHAIQQALEKIALYAQYQVL